MPLVRKKALVGCTGSSLVQGRLNNDWWARFIKDAPQIAGALGPIDTINEGKGSTNSDWGLANIGLIAARRPSHVLIDTWSINDAAVTAGVPQVTEANHDLNVTAVVAALRAARADVRIALMTMSSVGAAGVALRPNLGNYYTRDVALAATLGTQLIDNYYGTALVPGGWPKPGPDVLYQIDPATGTPDLLHPTAAAFTTYSQPNIYKWWADECALYWPAL